MPRPAWFLIASTLALAACASSGAQKAQSDPQSTLMSGYLMGRYADLTKDPTLAAQNYANALKEAPDDSVLLEGAVSSALIAGDVDRAAAAAGMARVKGGESALARLTLASVALRAGRDGEVLSLTQANDSPPLDRLAARVLRAWAFAGENKTDQAIAALGDSGASALMSCVMGESYGNVLKVACSCA